MTSTELAMCPTMTLQDLVRILQGKSGARQPGDHGRVHRGPGGFPFAVGLDPPQQGRGQAQAAHQPRRSLCLAGCLFTDRHHQNLGHLTNRVEST